MGSYVRSCLEVERQTWRSFLSFWSVRHTNKLLATLTDFNSFQSCSLPTGNIGQPRQLQSRLCPTFTRRQMRAPSPFSAFSTSAPRSTRSTIAVYSIDLRTTTVSGDGSFSGSSHILRDDVNSCGTTGSPQSLYQSPLACCKGPSWGRSFLSYSAEVVAIVQHQGFKVHAFADDLQIYGSTAQNGAADLMARMSICIECVASWISSNRLRLNPSKTELMWLGTSRRLQHCDGFNMTVCGADVRPVDCVRDLGILIDSNMTLSNHVNNVAGICFYQLRQLRIIRRSLTTDAAHSLVRALIHTRVDYCNGLLAAGPKYLHEKLQSVLRAAARLVLQLPHRASVSEIMRGQLHWLEMPDRVRFKLCTLVYRCLHGLAPHYLSDLCTPATVHAHLRSSVTLERSLSVPRTKTKTILRSTWILLCFVCCLERTPRASAWPWTFAEQLQN